MDAEQIAVVKIWLGAMGNAGHATDVLECIEELEQQLTYQTDRAESFCTRLHEEEQRNEELRQRCETMSAYLRTHDHRLHDAAMQAAGNRKEHDERTRIYRQPLLVAYGCSVIAAFAIRRKD